MAATVSTAFTIMSSLFPVAEVMHYILLMVQLVVALNKLEQQHIKIALLFYSS
jgi:hypothetical protein